MASGTFNLGRFNVLNRTYDWAGAADGVFKIALIKNTYTFDATDADFTVSGLDIATYEISGGSYARQSVTQAGTTISQSTANVIFDDTVDHTFTAVPAGQTTSGAVIFYDGGTTATQIPIWWEEFSSAVVCNGGDITVQWDATNGVWKVS